MSVKISNKVWELSQTEGAELLVMLALADHCDDYGVCFPGVDRIAQKCRISRRSVQRIIKKLISMGEVCREIGKGSKVSSKRGDGFTNRYRIVLMGRQAGDTPIGAKMQKGGDKSGRKGVTNSAEGGDTAMSHKPSVEPSVESSVYGAFDNAQKKEGEDFSVEYTDSPKDSEDITDLFIYD